MRRGFARRLRGRVGAATCGATTLRVDADRPFVDEHGAVIGASPDWVWAVLLDVVGGSFQGAAAASYARLVGCRPAAAGGPRPLAVGSTVPGFRVVAAEAPTALDLEGRHRFSDYALRYRLEPLPDGATRLTARTEAAFPGLHGRAYRLAVIRTGFHRVLLRRQLATITRRAERA